MCINISNFTYINFRCIFLKQSLFFVLNFLKYFLSNYTKKIIKAIYELAQLSSMVATLYLV